jgi:hypothetical protein
MIPWGLAACPLALFVWVGIVHAMPQAAPERVPGWEPFPVAELPEFREGPLTGWYVYVYVGGEKVICANPTVWSGPRVIRCTQLVGVEKAEPEPAEPGGPVAEFDPASIVFDEIDLAACRSTARGQLYGCDR